MGQNGTIPRVHLYQGAPNSNIRTDGQKAAEAAAQHWFGENDWTFRLNSINDFYAFLMTLRGSLLTVKEVDIYAHAEPGRFQMGGDPFGYQNLDQFENQGWFLDFEPGAQVRFNSCNFAASADGEYFLARFASIFLCRGGTAYGANTYVISHPWIGTNFTLSPCGSGWVSAVVGADGKLKLHNSSHLNAQRLISRLEALKKKLTPLVPRKGTVVKIDPGDDLASAETEIPKHIAALKADYPAPTGMYDSDQNPPVSGKADWYKDLWRECQYVERLERQLH